VEYYYTFFGEQMEKETTGNWLEVGAHGRCLILALEKSTLHFGFYINLHKAFSSRHCLHDLSRKELCNLVEIFEKTLSLPSTTFTPVLIY
jgi:hypothetical protein